MKYVLGVSNGVYINGFVFVSGRNYNCGRETNLYDYIITYNMSVNTLCMR